MARMVIAEQHTARLNEILDAAQRLIYGVGYAQMTIQDLLAALEISKGAFYHYFDSKQALLEAVVARMVTQMMAVLQPVVDASDAPALAKLEAVFRTAAGWKTTRQDLLVGLLRVWYADENALVREKLSQATMRQMTALLQPVIAQGAAEGVMHADDPDLAGVVAMSLLQGMSAEMGVLLLAWDDYPDALQRLERLANAFTRGVERVLGIASGALNLIDPALWSNWGVALSRQEIGNTRSHV